jgi:N-acetylmuramoyl-L-alanine amidase
MWIFCTFASAKKLAKLRKKTMAHKAFSIIYKNLLALLVVWAACLSALWAAQMTIVLDAGHGGDNAGATGRFAKEKDVVLSIALKLGDLLSAHLPDTKVLYTRTTDTLIALEDRGIIANNANADLFVSIHANGSPASEPYGTETYVITYDKTNKNMETAVLENAAIEYEKNNEKYDEYYDMDVIVSSVAQNEFYRPQSIDLAGYVEEEFVKHISRHSRGPKEGPFLVLWKATMPRVLIEVGFITNPEEEKYIASDDGQNELAAAIFNAIVKYKKRHIDRQITAAPEPKPQTASRPPAKDNPRPSANGNPNLILPQKVSDNKITYHVQVLSVAQPLEKNARELKGLKPSGCYKSGSSYRYYVGKETSFKAIEPMMREMRKKFPDAFVVKLKNNMPYKD